MQDFRRIREIRVERYVFETNKLLIRLDKLLRNYPPNTDPVGRREHEQSIVTWIDDTIVNLCPSCASKFKILTRTKHHCRLCGAVMCSKCSEFIDFYFAHKLISPVGLDDDSAQSNQLEPQQQFNTNSSKPRSASITSIASTSSNISVALRSLMGGESGGSYNNEKQMADKIRLCLDCKQLLKMRNEKLNIAYSKPPIMSFYIELNECKAEINKLLPLLFTMSDSLK